MNKESRMFRTKTTQFLDTFMYQTHWLIMVT